MLVITPGRLRPSIGRSATTDPGARMMCVAGDFRDRIPVQYREDSGTGKLGFAVDNGNPTCPQQMFYATHELIDSRLLVGHQTCKICRGLRDTETKVAGPPAMNQQIGSGRQDFGWDAANVQACATHTLLLDEDDFCPALGRR